MIRRRGLIAGMGAMLAAPAIIRTAGLLMPTSIWATDPWWLAMHEQKPQFFMMPGYHEMRTQGLHTQILRVRKSQIEIQGLKPLCAVGYRQPWT